MQPWKAKDIKADPDPAYAISPNQKFTATFTDVFTVLLVGESSTLHSPMLGVRVGVGVRVKG